MLSKQSLSSTIQAIVCASVCGCVCLRERERVCSWRNKKCNSKILISRQIFNCTFSISTCNLKNLIFLNHETFMLASSSDSSYKARMRVCAYWKIQNANPKPKFLSQAINFMINSSTQREREEPGKERNELVSMSRERFLEPVSHIFASQITHKALKAKEN